MIRKALLVTSCFTALACLWFVCMELILKHPGYLERLWMAAFFVSQSLATIIAFATPANRLFRALTLPGAAVIASMGCHVLFAATSDRTIEGYVLLIGLALVVQAALTVTSLIRVEHIPRVA
jgi:hypothetical protein